MRKETRSPDAGTYGGPCYRTVCQESPAIYFNHSTRHHYCANCAKLLNKANQADAMRVFGHDLCTLNYKDDREFPCPNCDDGEIIAGSVNPNGQQRFTCNSCRHETSFP